MLNSSFSLQNSAFPMFICGEKVLVLGLATGLLRGSAASGKIAAWVIIAGLFMPLLAAFSAAFVGVFAKIGMEGKGIDSTLATTVRQRHHAQFSRHGLHRARRVGTSAEGSRMGFGDDRIIRAGRGDILALWVQGP